MIEAKRPHASSVARAAARTATPATRGLISTTSLVVLVLLTGCSQLEPATPVEPTTDPTQLYASLVLNHTAVNLTTDTSVPEYHTLQLFATPYNAAGTPIADAPTAMFRSLGDTNALRVNPDGRLEALGPANEIKVLATLVLNGVRNTDTAVVNVLAASPPPVLDTLSIQVPADSAIWYVPAPILGGASALTEFIVSFANLIPLRTLSPRVVDARGDPISGLTIDYVSLDPAVAQVDRRSGTVMPIGAGHVRVVARTYAFGVTRADTMVYAVQPPVAADVQVRPQGFVAREKDIPTTPVTTTIVAGGFVGWQHYYTTSVDITFDDPTHVVAPPPAFCDLLGPGPHCGAGDVPAFVGSERGIAPDGTILIRFRQFPVPGTYPYRSTTTGARGQVIVLPPSATLP